MSSARRVFRRSLLAMVSGVTRRTAVLLAPEADAAMPPLEVHAPYRVPGGLLVCDIKDTGRGTLEIELTAGGKPATARPVTVRYDGPGALAVRLADGAVLKNGLSLGTVSNGQPMTSRRFAVRFQLRRDDATRAGRTTSHYLPRTGRAIDESYFAGEDYLDYDTQSESVQQEVLDLLRAHGVRGPVLEIGCATGGTLMALRGEGFDVSGLDISSWAVEQARKKVGDVVATCDIDSEPVPPPIADRGPFGCFVLASVLEHFADPVGVIRKLGPIAAPSAAIVILTTNAGSLTSRIFGTDWEGHFDWTHKCVDTVTVPWLRTTLDGLGWVVRELRTWHLWDVSNDPTHATLRDWFTADARFRALLTERDLGDFVACVAVRRD